MNPKLHIFICTNERENSPKPSCGPKLNIEEYKKVKQWIRDNDLVKEIFCTRTHCLGFCNPKGGVILIHPGFKYHIDIQNVNQIIEILKKEYFNL